MVDVECPVVPTFQRDCEVSAARIGGSIAHAMPDVDSCEILFTTEDDGNDKSDGSIAHAMPDIDSCEITFTTYDDGNDKSDVQVSPAANSGEIVLSQLLRIGMTRAMPMASPTRFRVKWTVHRRSRRSRQE